MKENRIEEAIKIMEHWIEYEKNNKKKINRADELINIQKTILLDYKRVLNENEKLIYARNWYFEHTVGKICTPEMLDKILRNDYISKQKVKDKIKELKQEKVKYGNCLIEMYEDELVNRTIKILQELLESEE